MPITDHTICPAGRNDVILQWLCASENRVNSQGVAIRFLDSVHDWYHTRGSITVAQRDAVRNCMREAGANSSDTARSRIAEVYAPPSEPTSTRMFNRAATWEQAVNIPSGTFKVALDDDTDDLEQHQFMIHTLTRGRNTDLIGKRAVSRLVDGRWQAFAFITAGAKLKIWSRFQDQSDEEWARAADGMVYLLAQHHDGAYVLDRTISGTAPTDEGCDEDWRVIEQTRTCRACNSALEPSSGASSIRSSIHAGCAITGFSNHPRPRPGATPISTARRITTPRSYTVQEPVRTPTPASPELSELGTGWMR